jgi:uncharacterized protein YbbC (DUF1343 family)
VLQADGFAELKGKRVGLLTHPAGVNGSGISTIDVLRRASGVKLVALYAIEHGIYNELPREKRFPDQLDPRTGLMVYSLYNTKGEKPTPAQLAPIDTLVVDLQDIGTRSYTFVSAMKLAMEACFENGKELIVLDRPNPLGGLKVDGPPLDPALSVDNYVGAFPVPYVHGLTIGELAIMAKQKPGVLRVNERVRARGQLTVVRMRGWTRAMRWSDTGLTFVPTSTNIPNVEACEGYAMTGLGCFFGGFSHGIGTSTPFRRLVHDQASLAVVENQLRLLPLSGVSFRRINEPDRKGQPGIYIAITDYAAWRPTELSFWLMQLACKLEPKNPFAAATLGEQRGFLRHMGSTAFFNDMVTKGARTDIAAWLRQWREQAKTFQTQSRQYWLYR